MSKEPKNLKKAIEQVQNMSETSRILSSISSELYGDPKAFLKDHFKIIESSINSIRHVLPEELKDVRFENWDTSVVDKIENRLEEEKDLEGAIRVLAIIEMFEPESVSILTMAGGILEPVVKVIVGNSAHAAIVMTTFLSKVKQMFEESAQTTDEMAGTNFYNEIKKELLEDLKVN